MRKFRVAVALCAVFLSMLPGLLGAQQGPAGDAILLARSGQYDSALALLARERAAHPEDLDVRLAQARVLGWAGHWDQAAAGFDSVLAEHPSSADALVGRGYLDHWAGRDREARRRAEAALAIDSTNADALALRDAARRVRPRATLESSGHWSNDSDHNTGYWQSHTLSVPLTDDVRAIGIGKALEASDPVRSGWSYGAEAGLGWARDKVEASALAGAIRLDPHGPGGRTAGTYRGRLGWRPLPTLGVSAGYARYPFDETALLIGLGLDVESLEGGFDVHPMKRLVLTGGGGGLWFSDGNRRTAVHGAIAQDIGSHFTVGAAGQALGYRRSAFGYFSPGRFHLAEATLSMQVGSHGWDGRLGGGLGGQQVGRGGDTQTEWHVEARVGTSWGEGNRLEGFGGVTNSAVSSTTGAFRYRTAGLLLRLGL